MRFNCLNQAIDNRCLIYHEQPEMCRSYPEPEMFARGGDLLPGCGYRVVKDRPAGERFEAALQREFERPERNLPDR